MVRSREYVDGAMSLLRPLTSWFHQNGEEARGVFYRGTNDINSIVFNFKFIIIITNLFGRIYFFLIFTLWFHDIPDLIPYSTK